MTQEELEKGRKIREKIERLYDYRRTILPFISERIELKISWEKGLYSYIPDEETHREITLYPSDPMLEVIKMAIDTKIAEYEAQFEEIGKPKNEEQIMLQEKNTPSKKVWWKRFFGKS